MKHIIHSKKIQLSDHRAQLAKVERRLFLKQGLSLGALKVNLHRALNALRVQMRGRE